MVLTPIPRKAIATARLALRPSTAADAARAFEIQSDQAVTRMLRMASFPPDRAEIEAERGITVLARRDEPGVEWH